MTMLRHRDRVLDDITKLKIVSFLAGKLGEKAPSADEELAHPDKADAFYERCGTWLRENTRDQKRFAILFNDNVTYGYRRNLLGLKSIALTLNALVLTTVAVILWLRWDQGFAEELNGKILSVAVIACLHSVYLLLGVTEASVAEASRTYSRQLLQSCISLGEATTHKKTPTPRSASERR